MTVNIKPPRAMRARNPIYLYVSRLNLKSTGLGYIIDRTNSPFAVEKPESQRHFKLILYLSVSYLRYNSGLYLDIFTP